MEKEKEKNKSMWKKIIIIFGICTVVICCTLLYSRFISTKGLEIREYKIVNEKITDNFHGLKIVHISDVHYGTTIYKKELEKIVEKINLLKPDIVVLTGDLLDQHTEFKKSYEKEITETLSKIETTIGKYAITGNHDYKFKNFNTIIEKSGFTNLNDSYDKIYKKGNNFILLSGISTNMHGDKKLDEKIESTTTLLNNIPEEERKNIYKILLVHEPDVIDNINIDFDLILAGHSHNGQVRLPFIGAIKKVELAEKYYEEHYTVNNKELYISGGLGTSTVKFRFFNKPSFNFYRITNK